MASSTNKLEQTGPGLRRRIKRTSGALALFATVGVTPTAHAGGEHGVGGADTYRVTPAFFLSWNEKEVVRACIDAAPDFGFTSAQLSALVTRAVGEWSDYFRAKRLDLGRSPYIARRFAVSERCQGNENLKLYFGVENDEVRKHKTPYIKPFGFSELTQPSVPENWQAPLGQGFVWIAGPDSVDAKNRIPTWNTQTEPALYGLLLHEIGHVFGNSHVENTIMTKEIANLLYEDTNPSQSPRFRNRYSRIDSGLELVPCLECKAEYTGTETRDPMFRPNDPEGSDWLHTFRRFVDRHPQGRMKFSYTRLGSPEGSGRLTLADELGSHVFDVKITNEGTESPPSAPLFLGQGGAPIYFFGVVYTGLMTTLRGEHVPVLVSYNMTFNKVGRRAMIKPMGAGETFFPRPVFVSEQ